MKNVHYTTLVILLLLCMVPALCQETYYASNRVLNAVNSYDASGNYIEEFIEKDAGGLNSPQDIILHPQGFLLVTGSLNERIKKFDATTGAYLGEWSDVSFALGRPSKMSIGPDNLLLLPNGGKQHLPQKWCAST